MNTFKISNFVMVLIMISLSVEANYLKYVAPSSRHAMVPPGAYSSPAVGQETAINYRLGYGPYGGVIAATRGKKGGLRINALTCDKSPKVCRLKGSSGRDCCRKKCVDLRTNKLNCGRCGKSCQYSEVCCNGYCVNPMFDRRHCGGCFKKCNKGRSCAYGMCSYA
ncbi:unnamed protein product [Thlaspi arvense]|uniref:Stigma-specific Stig1 family protein n=1 Tax=Thlaspi arvense TaxID=13288 RepID=A0AAU9RCV1_THLAR|nr:unnamed protein product [Thlaspi arvense]